MLGNEGEKPSTIKTYSKPVPVTGSTRLKAWTEGGNVVTQTFQFSKSTGKAIKLTEEPTSNYPGDGAFTLINGVVNEKA